MGWGEGSFCLILHILHVSLYHRLLLGDSINTLLIKRLIALVFTAHWLICSNGPESKCSHHQPAVTYSTPLTFSCQTHFIRRHDCNFFLFPYSFKGTICSFDAAPPTTTLINAHCRKSLHCSFVLFWFVLSILLTLFSLSPLFYVSLFFFASRCMLAWPFHRETRLAHLPRQ